MAERKKKEQVLQEAGIAPTLPTDTTKRTFLARGVKGRDGDGPCTVLKKGAKMPDGDVAHVGDTFDPVEEGMAPVKLRHLYKLGRINNPGDDVLQACAKAHKSGGYKTKPGAPSKTKPELPDTGETAPQVEATKIAEDTVGKGKIQKSKGPTDGEGAGSKK